MPYLIASLLALALGPLLAIGARRFRASTIALDAFVLVTLGGLVALHILPHALEGAGLWALLVAAFAFVLTGSAEHSLRHGGGAGRVGRRLFFALALLGLGLHAVVDGLALTGTELHGDHVHADGSLHEADGTIWALAVLLHRVPVAISLWWIVAPLIGLRTAILCMVVLAVGTLAGYAVGAGALTAASPTTLALFEALLCGTLMHVVLHADLPPAPKDANPWLNRIATLCGLAAGVGVVVAVEGGHAHGPEGGPGMGSTFVHLALESAPALLLAYLAVGLAQAFLPPGFVARRAGRGPLRDALRGVAIGLPLPVCSCGVVPMYRDLIRQGAGLAAGIAFLIATPELEFAAILLTWELLGGEIALARVGAAAVLALVVAVAVARISRDVDGAAGELLEPPVPPAPGLRDRLGRALRSGFGEAVDETAAWILLGLALAAFLTPLLDPGALAGVSSWIGVPLAAVLGMPLYVCASGSTPLAAVLVAKGLSPGAALAFLLTGPATNITTFGVLSRLHERRTAVAFALLMFAGATVAGWLTDLMIGRIEGPAEVFASAEHRGSTLQWICLAILGAIVLASLLRQGIRRFLGQIFDTPSLAELTGGHHDHDHDHCAHD
jgi:uncharacterized membrane protein YraQ (UPF0718 family)